MKPLVAHTLRSRWLAGMVHVGLWLLVYLAVRGLSGSTPPYREVVAPATTVPVPAAIGKLNQLFVANTYPVVTVPSNVLSPFGTRHFIPAPAPPAPAPTTRKIDLTYQGFYLTEEGVKQTMVKMGDAFLVVPEGAKLTANLYAVRASVMSLLLTNDAGKTNLLPLNQKQDVEIPIK